jgi:hypothetical protein
MVRAAGTDYCALYCLRDEISRGYVKHSDVCLIPKTVPGAARCPDEEVPAADCYVADGRVAGLRVSTSYLALFELPSRDLDCVDRRIPRVSREY